VVELKVSGAFHSPLMEPAAEGLEKRLASVTFADPVFPVVSNVTAEPVTDGPRARALLVEQLTSGVRWRASIERMTADGVDHFLELGPGSVLCGLNRRNARDARCSALGEPGDLESIES
jgi:[acyl-carrier-protein] S-malonyltransferase